MLKIDLYKNKNQESRQYGKVYGRVNNATPIEIPELAKHMSLHNTPFSKGVIQGILTDMAACIKELMLQGQPVKLADLAIFKASVISTPAVSVEKFDLQQNIKKVRLCAVATGEVSRKRLTDEAMLGYTSMGNRLKAGEATLSNEKGKYLDNGQ
ncbi:MAG: DNA-binding protein [Prevotella sp.]|nr:DNA-binding protein [Prevotella sp.]